MKRLFLFLALLSTASVCSAETPGENSLLDDNPLLSENSVLGESSLLDGNSVLSGDSVKPKKKNFGQVLLTPVKWIIKNWSASDPRYCVPSFYNWAAQLQNTTSFEWVNLNTPEGMQLNMRSRVSNRLGPYFGWRWIFLGTTIDLSSIGRPASRKSEFTLSINSHLFNIDLIRRRTGGDFMISKLTYTDPDLGLMDFKDLFQEAEVNMGDYIKNSLTGVNINYFINHKKYSNPAAFTNGAIQLRSQGTPIVGIGYTRQKVECDMSMLFTSLGAAFLEDGNGNSLLSDAEWDRLAQLSEDNPTAFHNEFASYLRQGWANLNRYSIGEGNFVKSVLANQIPTETVIDDWHLQLGYAYNLAFSRRVLLGLSASVSPSLKYVRWNNENSLAYEFANELSALCREYDNRDYKPIDFQYHRSDTRFTLNTFLRASLTFNFNRWRAGVTASFSNYFYNYGGLKVNNTFGNVDTYVGYCFGRKKEYRYNGKNRQYYITAALTAKQIEDMHDTKPESNLDKGPSYLETMGKTRKYHTDIYDLDIEGCDLVRGPEGKYGWYELKDGYVSPQQDTEGRLYSGKVVEIDSKGCFEISAGHKANFRTGNWWKSHLAINQLPNQWYPEMLNYALCGKLTLYLRGRIFGTKKPVKLEIDDFFINQGKDAKNFTQMGIKSFRSRSTYSIEGRAEVNGRECRIYIEQKKRGRVTLMYVSRVYPSYSEWMAKLDGERPVSTISIPGTHDAGTASLEESVIVNSAHTQNFSVPDQLRDGIRAFDIRLKNNLKYGHTFATREGFDSTMVEWDQFLTEHPSEVIIAMIGIDGGGKWNPELTKNYMALINKYPHRFVEKFDARTTLDEVRGKILVIRRQEDCPFGKLLKFTDNAVFDYDCFHVEDVYKEFKTWKKEKLVETNIREAFENDNPDKWYITFNSVSWSPRRHIPYAYAWGGKAKNIRRPLNKVLRENVELKDYADFGMVFLDFYNDHGEHPQLVETIIDSNFHIDEEQFSE